MQALLLVTVGMFALPVLVALGFVWLHGRASERSGGSRARAQALAALAVSAWMALFAALAEAGVLARFELTPPPLAFVVLAVSAGGSALGFGSVGTGFARTLPLSWLVLAQAFRLPLELVMHQAAREGVMPHEMSYSGYNFDIVTGASAIPLALLLFAGRAPRGLVLAWNIMGSLLLAVVVSIALAATPLFKLFGDDPRHLNTFVAHFPFVWLPTVLVLCALFGHITVFRALRWQKVQEARPAALA
jgi:hypothetical protein